MKQYVTHYPSPWGDITLSSDGDSITGLWFEGQKFFGSTLCSGWLENDDIPLFHQTKEWLRLYFGGHGPGAIPPVRLIGTPFRLSVWHLLLEIPYGTVCTYGDIARRLAHRRGMTRLSAQAVGSAVAHNPISILVPCHRVVGAGGKLGGYAGGLPRKISLLEGEGSIGLIREKLPF